MHRFFIDSTALEGDLVKISGSDFNHISHSLRLQVEDRIIVSTGNGMDLIVELTEFGDKELYAKVIKKEKNTNEPTVSVSLAQAVPKKNNMDLIVQKCTEIGINKIIPLSSNRTIVKLNSKKEDKKVRRWQRIAKEAAKQSQRGLIPVIEPLHTVKELLQVRDEYDLILILWAREEKQGLKDILSQVGKNEIKNILIIVGPEGGFEEKEVNLLESEMKGYPLTLGPRILRTETAGLVGLSLLLYEFEDLGG